MVIERGAIHWADLGPRRGSRPAKRRPVLIVQADSYNRSRLRTVVAAVVTSSTRLARMPGNVFVPAGASGLPRDSVVNVTGLIALDRAELGEFVGRLDSIRMADVDGGLRRVLAL